MIGMRWNCGPCVCMPLCQHVVVSTSSELGFVDVSVLSHPVQTWWTSASSAPSGDWLWRGMKVRHVIRSVDDVPTSCRRVARAYFSHLQWLPQIGQWEEKGKGKEEYLYSAILVRTHTLKALRHGSYSFTYKQHDACLFMVALCNRADHNIFIL